MSLARIRRGRQRRLMQVNHALARGAMLEKAHRIIRRQRFRVSRTVRRTLGAAAVLGGALLMWLSPKPLESAEMLAGGLLMAAGVALELIGIALEKR